MFGFAASLEALSRTGHSSHHIQYRHGHAKCSDMSYGIALPLPPTKRPRLPGKSLFDSGATHYVRSTDVGAIPGSWRKDVPGLWVGNKQFLPVFGSVEMDFIPPPDVGGPDIRRRVLIAPGVLYDIWSHSAEVDHYKSTVTTRVPWSTLPVVPRSSWPTAGRYPS